MHTNKNLRGPSASICKNPFEKLMEMNYQSFIHMYIMVLIFVMDGETNIFCVICDQAENDENILNQIGSSRKGTGHPFNTLLSQATKCGIKTEK